MSALAPGDHVEYLGPEAPDRGFVVGAVYVVAAIVAAHACSRCRRYINGGVILGGLRYPAGRSNCPCQLRPVSDGQERIERPARVCVPA